jgi:hypothetical protein
MPNEGTAAFQLVSSDAVMQAAGGSAVAADVSNGRLSVDFGARTFATSLDVSSTLGSLKLSANGAVTQNGGLEGALLAPVSVRGYLGGALAGEAVYGFKTNDNTQLSAQGITRWSR